MRARTRPEHTLAPVTISTEDAAGWLRRWDMQQQRHIPHREERFAAITEMLAAAGRGSPRILDLGCGPGSLSVRVLERVPGAEIAAVDADPALLALGRAALAGDPRIRFVDADLRGGWEGSLPLAPPFDAAVSTTALHWLTLPELVSLFRTLAALIRPGGVFLNGDKLDFGHDQQAIAAAVGAVRSGREAPESGTAQDWEGWWASIEREPALAAELGERRRRGHDHPHDSERHTLEFHRAALLAAGFAEVATVWQQLDDRVLMAVR